MILSRKQKVGANRSTHPLPLRLRNPFVAQNLGGSAGWRGPGWRRIRRDVLIRDGLRSTISGLSAAEAKLEVDHIHPFRYADPSYCNNPINLRTTDMVNNPALDPATPEWQRQRLLGKKR